MSYFPRMLPRDSADLNNEARFYHNSTAIPPSLPFQSSRGPPQLNPWRRADDTIQATFFSIDGGRLPQLNPWRRADDTILATFFSIDGGPPQLNPWRRAGDDTIMAGFFSIDGEIHDGRQDPRFVSLNDERLEMEAMRRSSQWPAPTIQFHEDSKLTREEQEKALKKLKKEVYNPVPKTITRRISLYYRDRNAIPNSINEKGKEIEEEGKRCAVCLDDFEPKQEVTLTPCKHMFHEDCIAPWVRSHGHCPVCRFSLCDQIGHRPPTIVNFPADAVPTREIRPFYFEEDYDLQNLSRRYSS